MDCENAAETVVCARSVDGFSKTRRSKTYYDGRCFDLSSARRARSP